MKKLSFCILLFLLLIVSDAFAGIPEKDRETGFNYQKWSTVDHRKIELIQKEFKHPEEVTKACIYCHTNASKQVHKTIHWTWKCDADKTKTLGKSGITLNNF